MKWIFPCALAMTQVLTIQVRAEIAELVETDAATKGFEVSSVIAAPVAALRTHIAVGGLGDSELLVFTPSEVARVNVRKGFLLINTSWDFEAYRHFSSALRADPECLMAYCGVVLSLTNPEHEFKEQRAVAFNRMLSLAEHKVDGEFVYPENERMYAVGLAELLVNGPARGVRVFKQLAKDYPNDMQAQLFSCYLSRGGYNALGNARVNQRAAVERVQQIVQQNPDHTTALNFLILLQSEAPYQALDFKKELLPAAQKLVALSEGRVASWQSLLGYVAWRSGDLEVAEEAFRASVSLYQEWQQNNKVGFADSEGLIRTQLFLVNLLQEQGKPKEALALSKEINNYQVAKGREVSTGALALKWHAGLMTSKLHMESGDYKMAKAALPTLPKMKKLDTFAAVVTSYQLFLEASILAENGKVSQARELHGRLAEQLIQMQKMQREASLSPALADFIRSLNSLTILHNELTAKLSLKGGLSYNWYQTAIDAQRPDSHLLPPDILYPIEYKLGLYYLSEGEKVKAKEAFEAALLRRPSYQKAAAQLKVL